MRSSPAENNRWERRRCASGATTPGAVYTGLAINLAQTQLYAANTAGPGSVDVFNSSFAPMGTIQPPPTLVPSTLVPFNVQSIGKAKSM